MTTDELNAIVQAVMLEMEKAGVDFDFKAETPQPTDLVYVMRGTSDKYQGITVKWQNLLDIIVQKATEAKDEAVSAKDIALQTLATIQSIESNVNSMKSSVDESEANVASMKASVEASETRVTQIKAEAEQTLAEATQTVSGKADKTYVDGELAKKADITYVDGKLANKADKSELAVERARIDSLSTLPEGSTTGDAELIGIRIGADGVTYPNAGEAVRTQISDLKGDLDNKFYCKMTNGGYVHSNGYIEPNPSYSYTDYVKVKKDEVITFEHCLIYSSQALCGYDREKNFVSRLDKYSDGVNGGDISVTITVPDGIYYIRCTSKLNNTITYKYKGIAKIVIENRGDCEDTMRKSLKNENNITALEDGFVYLDENKWSLGSIGSSGQIGTNAKYRIVTPQLLHFKRKTKVLILDGYRLLIALYDENETFINSSEWKTGTCYIPSGSYVKLMLAKKDENANEKISDIYLFSTNVLFDSFIEYRLSGLENNLNLIPNYWEEHIISKENIINTLNQNIGADGCSFVFFTDYHQNSNNGKSISLIDHILKNTSVSDVFYGGDTTDGGSLPDTNSAISVLRDFTNSVKNLNIKTIRGNHDCEPTANTTTNQINDNQYYDLFVRPIEKEAITNGNLYYYIDNNSQKIRFIVMDSGGMNNPLNNEQVNWLKARLTELSSEWSVIIFQHIIGEGNSSEQTFTIETRGNITLNAIHDIYTNLNCTIIAMIGGHAHVDYKTESQDGFPIIITTCDSGGNNASYDWNYPNRVKGTTTEQAFDVFSIDKRNKKIYCTRIGAGADREFNY